MVGTFGTITFAPDAEKKILNGNFTIPQDPANPKLDLLNQCKISAFINEQMSPLRAGQYNVKVTVDSADIVVIPSPIKLSRNFLFSLRLCNLLQGIIRHCIDSL